MLLFFKCYGITKNFYYISNSGIVTGIVYQSLYFGFRAESSKWDGKSGILCWRDENAFVLDLRLDDMSYDGIAYIDPTEDDLWSILDGYYNLYYQHFDKMDEVLNQYLKKDN